MIFIVLALLLLIIFFHKYYSLIGVKTNLIDKPDGKRKIHSGKIPLMGGVLIILSSILLILSSYKFDDQVPRLILFCSLSLGLLGMLDDRYNIDSFSRLLISSFIIYYFFKSYDYFLITDLLISNSFEISLQNHLSMIFTIFCVICLINSYNMIDGIDGLAISIFIIWYLFITNFLTQISNTEILILIPCVYFLLLNYKGKIFLGDSGTYFLATFISLTIIYRYNFDPYFKYTTAGSILILLGIPGIDMIRLVILRLFKLKNPLKADNNHLHHILIKKYGWKVTIIIYSSSVFIFNSLFFFSILPIIIILLLMLIAYLALIIFKKA